MRYRLDGPAGLTGPYLLDKISLEGVRELQRMLFDRSMDFHVLARRIEEHPGVAAHFLRRINSVGFGSGRKITSLHHALVLMGTTIINRELDSMANLLQQETVLS